MTTDKNLSLASNVRPCIKPIASANNAVQLVGIRRHQLQHPACDVANFVHSDTVRVLQRSDRILSDAIRIVGLGAQIERLDRSAPLSERIPKPAKRIDQGERLGRGCKDWNCHRAPLKRLNEDRSQSGIHRWMDRVDCQRRATEIVTQLDQLHGEFFHCSRSNRSFYELSPFHWSNDRIVSDASGQPTPKPRKDRRRDCPSLPSRCASLPGPPASAHRIQKFHFLTPQSVGQHSAMPSEPRSGFATLATVKPPRNRRTRLREDV